MLRSLSAALIVAAATANSLKNYANKDCSGTGVVAADFTDAELQTQAGVCIPGNPNSKGVCNGNTIRFYFFSPTDVGCTSALPTSQCNFPVTLESNLNDILSNPTSLISDCYFDVPNGECILLFDLGASASSAKATYTCGTGGTSDNPCFAKATTTACKLADESATAASAYEACYLTPWYKPKADHVAESVLMASLAAGDKVLTATAAGDLEITRVVVNQHVVDDHTSKMLEVQTADGSALSLTPEHALFVDGTLTAASDAKVGCTLTRADGSTVKISRVTEVEAAAVINPVTASGTILASDAGAPLLAASHPMWIAPLLVESPTVRALANAALYVVGGDVTNWAVFGAVLLAKLGAPLAAAAVVKKLLVKRGSK